MTRSVKEIQRVIQEIFEVKEEATRNKIKNEAALEQVKDEAKKLKTECKKLGIEPKNIKKEMDKVTKALDKELDIASEIVEKLEALESEQDDDEEL